MFLLAIFAFLAIPPYPAGAVMEVDITQGNIRPIPIAISPFLAGASGQSAQLADAVTGIIAADLERSGLFKPIDRAAFLERIYTVDAPPRFRDWSVINAEALAVGQITDAGGGQIKAQFRLWDVYSGRELTGESFTTSSDNWRRIGHIIADAIYQRLTGEKAYFDSRIAFIEESGPRNKRVKRLALMDQDGQNLRVLTKGTSLVLTPRFSPNNREITYTSYEGGRPSVIRMDIASGRQEVVANFPGMTFAPRFSPRGDRIIMSLQQDSASNLFEMDLDSRQLRRLTTTQAIDTGPCYSPDGRQIVFESDRAGGRQQLFVMNADGSGQRQLTGGDGRYSTPVWSPRGDLIAFTKQIGGQFLIGVIQPDGRGERILTEGYHNEGPSWSPNGRVLTFFRESQGESGGPRLFTIDLTGYNERVLPTSAFASDPSWSPLMK
ncbi:Tol-Pal system beta propeller repeat protein TolB [Rhodomicrobium sp. R_RK_3]|uniref:Tol-Pal system beta propeller repeat protein TolB n=1 Tax=Rhodomicrobium TaxID=1068 RepID=UPI0032AE94F4